MFYTVKNKKVLLGLLIIVCVSLLLNNLCFVKAAEDDGWPQGPEVKGDGAIVVDAETGNILYEKNIYEQFYPASTTKILTTLVALENGRLDDVLTVSYAADNYVSKTSSRMGLTEGEQVTVEQALYGIMLESGNEATYAVGEHVGKSIAGFIKLMNKKAKALGCDRSHFANSHGLHDEDHYTCCYDMSLIARAAYKNEDFMKITGTAFYNMPATNKHEAKILTNHHWFLNGTQKYDYCIGGKTGATTQAGYALVTYARKDGKNLISVVMHAPTWADVYADTKRLLDYCFDNFVSYQMEDLGETATDFPSCFDNFEAFNDLEEPFITISGAGSIMVPEGFDISKAKKEIVYNTDMELEHGRNVIGSIEYTSGSRVIGAADIIVYNSDYPITEKSFNERWPAYMIPVDTAFEGVDASQLNQIGKKDKNIQEQQFLKENAIAIGIGAGVAIFIVGGLIAVIRKKSRRRR
jgi:D-alanyl-D-alanine carboxypeptidase